MGNLRKAIASLSVVAVLSTLVVSTTAFAMDVYTDVPTTHWFHALAAQAKEMGLMTNAAANPDKEMGRDESVKMVVNGAEISMEDLEDLPAGVFTDVKASDWVLKDGFLKAALQAKIVTPKASFYPAGKTNRAEAAALIVRAFGFDNATPTKAFPDLKIKAGDWISDSVYTLNCYGVFNGYKDGTAGVGKNISKSEFAALVIRASENPELKADCEGVEPEPDPDPTPDPTPDPVTGGDLEVSISADNPSTDTVPAGATSVPFAAWDFEAGSTGAVVKSLTIHKWGVINLHATHSCYLYEGNNRLTSGVSVNGTTNNATFNGLNYSVSANTKKTVWLKCDMGPTAAAGSGGFEIVDAAAVNAGESEVSGSFPLKTEKFDFSSTAVGTVTVTSNGSVAAPKVGEDDVTISKFKIDVATEAAKLEKVGVYFGAGTLSTSDLQNLELYVSGETDPIATVESLNSKDVAQFVLSTPLKIEKGDNKTLLVKGDLNPGRSADTILAYIDETTDVLAIGDTYGFGMTVTIAGTTGYDGTTCTAADQADCTRSVVEGGDITITSPGPAAVEVGINGKDVVLQEFTIATAGDVTFKNFPVSLDTSAESGDHTEGLLNTATDTTSGSVANFTDIKIGCGESNETVWGPVDVTSFTTAIGAGTAIVETGTGDTVESFYLFTNEKTFEAGEEVTCKLTADIANTATLSGMTVVSSLELGTSYPEVRDANNKVVTNSTALVPSANIGGKTMTVGSPSLTLSLAATPVAGSTEYVKGQKKVKFTGITALCGSSSNCKVKDVTLTGDIDEEGDANDFTAGADGTVSTNLNSIVGSVWLEDQAGAVVAAAKPVQSTGVVNFTNINWTINKGETGIFYVVGDVSSNGYANSTNDNVSFGINLATDLKFEDNSGTTRDATNTINATNAVYATIIGGGSLTISVDSATANEDILVAGAADQNVSKFKFETTKEAFVVTKLSINARQTTVTSVGANDNNIANVKISYTNSAGTTETKTGSVASGTVQFSGMDFYIGKDTGAVLTVTASTNEIIDGGGGSTAGEFIDLNVAFNNFESVAQSSGDTYKADKIDSGLGASITAGNSSDLDFTGATGATSTGSLITWTAALCDVNDADEQAVGTPGSTLTLVVDGCGTNVFPVGTLIMAGADTTWTDASDSIFVVTTPTTTTSMSLTVLDDDDASLADTLELFYALPGEGYLTNTNRMYVYKTLPTLAQSATAPTGSKTISPTDTIFEFTITPNAKDDAIVRQGLEVDDDSDPVETTIGEGEVVVTDVTVGTHVIDGTAAIKLAPTTLADNDCFLFNQTFTAGTTAGSLGSFKYVSFWIKSDQVDTTYDAFEVIGDDDAACTAGGDDKVDHAATNTFVNGTAISAGSQIIGGGTANLWELVTVDISGLDTTNNTRLGIAVDLAGGTTDITDGEVIYFDGVVLHNEMLVVDLAGNAVFDTTPSSVVDCTLKKGTAVVAAGAVGVQTTSQGRIIIVPQNNVSGTDYSDLVISKGVANTYSLVCDSQALITQSVNDDNLTPSVDYGSSVDGTVTRGDFWWSADEATKTLVYWLGNVGTKLSGNTLKY